MWPRAARKVRISVSEIRLESDRKAYLSALNAIDFEEGVVIGSYVGLLEQQINSLEKEVRDLRKFKESATKLYKYTHLNAKKSVEEKTQLRDQNECFHKALGFYADRKSWELGDPYEPRDCEIWRDQGSIACKALEGEK